MQLNDENNFYLENEEIFREGQKHPDSDSEVLNSSADSTLPGSTKESLTPRWLQIVEKAAIPLAATLLGSVIGLAQWQVDLKRGEREQEIAADNQRYSVLSDYFDDMTELQLDKGLIENLSSQPIMTLSEGKQARQIARAKTLTSLRQLNGDGERKGQLLKFLYEAKLIGNQCQNNPETLEVLNCLEPILDLDGARLEEVKLEPPIPLKGIDLDKALLAGANLQGIDLTKAEMQGAILKGANLTGALLAESKMAKTDLEGAILTGAFLWSADLANAKLINANLQEADLRDTDLTEASLQGANFKGAKYNNSTKFPNQFNPAEEGMKLCPPLIDQKCE